VSVLFVLVPLAILIVAIFVAAYVWSSRTGQFDDLTTPAMRALHDDAGARPRSAQGGDKPGSVPRRAQGVDDDGDVDPLLK
jgi:cbb3-type cytochrome oxidase maturation protein